jgi:hypothetical protein
VIVNSGKGGLTTYRRGSKGKGQITRLEQTAKEKAGTKRHEKIIFLVKKLVNGRDRQEI